ncbi:hypothetical protein I3842_05G194100 [Carya illinoinensis]|uniref:Uncharacterized protein n=1 Tax=Carya illinoinensis TaxID=32201 RepID=A0A922F1L8_CARIL|nr:hypothetical protein I3842_05G194100 [Carya illinoinensis]
MIVASAWCKRRATGHLINLFYLSLSLSLSVGCNFHTKSFHNSSSTGFGFGFTQPNKNFPVLFH